MKLLAAMSIALVGCAEPYVHVIAEGTDPELVQNLFQIEVAAYNDDQRIDFSYVKPFEKLAGGKARTDFVLTGEITEPLQLRVYSMLLSHPMFADAMLDATTPQTLQLTLASGERTLGVARSSFAPREGQPPRGMDHATLYDGSLILAWVNSQGLQVRRDNDPDDEAPGRATLLDPDPNVTSVRLASRTERDNYHPAVYAMAWLDRMGTPKVRVTSEKVDHDPVIIGAPGATDLRVAAAFEGQDFTGILATLAEGKLRLTTFDKIGAMITTGVLQDTGTVDEVRGVAVTNDGKIIVGFTSSGTSHLWRFDSTMLDGSTAEKEQVMNGELLSMVLGPDDGKLYTFQVKSGNILANVVYNTYNDFAPSGVEVELGEMLSGGEIGVSRCLVTWPVRRSSSVDAIDLRYVVLGPDGLPKGPSRPLNAEEQHDHVRPTGLCGSETRAWSVFLQQSNRNIPEGALFLRRIPSKP